MQTMPMDQPNLMARSLIFAILLLCSSCLYSQTRITLTVKDTRGNVLEGAAVLDAQGSALGRTDHSGRLDLACSAPCHLRVSAPGFADRELDLASSTVIQLQPAVNAELVTVTAYRSPLGGLQSPVTTRLLSQETLDSTASQTLDGEVRQLPGVELFRRSSSLVANPSSQGISLRALGSTSASRTLLVADDVPLNDAFSGVIHWQEQPELAIKGLELMRGGGSDLYGSSAIGGVVSLLPARPLHSQGEIKSSYGAEGTYGTSLMIQQKRGSYGLLAAGGVIGTDGFIQEAPTQRGPVDINSNVHSQNGLTLIDRQRSALRLFARAGGFNEARDNGTPFQTNGTRIWRYATGADWEAPHGATLAARAYGSTEHSRQSFSSIVNAPTAADPACSYRCGETPTKYSHTPDNELGAAAHWSQPLGSGLLLIAGADSHDVRVWDREQSYGSAAAITHLHDHQRDSSVYSEAMWARRDWTITAAGRMDWFQNFDGQQLKLNGPLWAPTASQPSQFNQRFFDPRFGISKKLHDHWSLSASGFRAFREPTPNELYRSTQVGNKLTMPNSNLLSERATGWEAGIAGEHPWASARLSYFLTQVNRPITAVTVNAASSPILLMRQNLGQIESRGISTDFDITPRRWLAFDGGYQYARATVTKGNQDAGNWIPEVARNMATMNLRAHRQALGTFSLQSRLSGHQFDDDANAYLLHGYFRLDAFASHEFQGRLEVFAAGENLLNRQIEVSKTPTTTLATPRVERVGLTVFIGRQQNR